MKKLFKCLLVIVVLCLLIFPFFKFKSFKNDQNKEILNSKIEEKVNKRNNYVSYNGNLKVKEKTLVNEHGENIVLRGVSSHGIQWFKDLVTKENLKTLKEWGSNVFRIAMYTEEGGYIENVSLKEDVKNIINLCIELDMYVVIDWHILNDKDPMKYIDESKNFFKEMSELYKDTPNIIYEICNEPNGNEVTWENNIKPYAEEIIKVIRENSKKSLILVGTGTWSQDIDKAATNPLADENIMYSLHFYSGTHTSWLRNRAKESLNKIPIFVSEWGVSDASGNGGVFLDEANLWIDFMNENSISWINWSLSNKNESSAILKPNEIDLSNEENLSKSGLFVKKMLNRDRKF